MLKIIGSSGTSKPAPKNDGIDYKLLYEKEKKENAEKDARIKALESRNKLLVANLEHLRETITKALSVTAPNA